MDDKPNIETAVKDYGNKKIDIIKLDIILTIVLLALSGVLFYTLYPKIKNSHFMGSIKENDIITTTKVSSEDKIDVEELESKKYVIYKVTNSSGQTKDITVRLNTYIEGNIDNTLSYQASSIRDNEYFYAYFDKEDLKIYDKYEYIINSSNSIYSSIKDSVKLTIDDFDQRKYVYTNESGSVINNLNVVILYYDEKKNIVEIEEKNKTLIEKDGSFIVNVKRNYEDFDVYLNEAYYIKKES